MSKAGLGVLDGRINFVLGARFYLKGLAMYQIIKTFYDNYTLLKNRIRAPSMKDFIRKSIQGLLKGAVNLQEFQV